MDASKKQTSAIPFLAWEKPVAAGLSAVIAVSILWSFIVQVKYSAMMLEYVQKFLPAFLDNGITAIFDSTGIGDPRPRLLANLLAFLNINVRAILSGWMTIHPSLSVNWVLFPVALTLLYKAAFYMTASTRCAFMSTGLYAASPSLLDTLVNYYIPAKPLASLMLIGGIYGAARVAPHPNTGLASRPVLGAMIIFATTLSGLLSDETAIFTLAFLPVLFCHILWPIKPIKSGAVAISGAPLAAGIGFAFTALYILPRINLSLEQIPLDFPRVVVSGVYQALFGRHVPSAFEAIRNYSPLALLAVIVSAHAIPFRVVTDIWTRNTPLDHLWQWHEQTSLVFFVCLVLFLYHRLRPEDRPYLLRLVVTFLIFVFLQALVILPLAPRIVEVNYYAGFSSIFFALIVGHLVSACNQSANLRLIGWFILTYLIATQYGNFVATAQRHPGFDKTEQSWSLLTETRKHVANGEFSQVAKSHPFPSRLFLWAFEYEAFREHAVGRKVDLRPMGRPSDTLYGALDLKLAADPKLVPYKTLIPLDEAEVIREGALLASVGPASAQLLRGRVLEGAAGPWNYRRDINKAGMVTQRIWYTGLMRLWNDNGKLTQEDGKICLIFEKTGKECVARLYRLGNVFYGFDSNSELVTFFRWVGTS